MHGQECEGRFLGVKLDEYSTSGGSRGRQDRDMDLDRPSGSRRERSDRPSRSSASHKGRQVSALINIVHDQGSFDINEYCCLT